jgi:hypothetical protein
MPSYLAPGAVSFPPAGGLLLPGQAPPGVFGAVGALGGGYAQGVPNQNVPVPEKVPPQAFIRRVLGIFEPMEQFAMNKLTIYGYQSRAFLSSLVSSVGVLGQLLALPELLRSTPYAASRHTGPLRQRTETALLILRWTLHLPIVLIFTGFEPFRSLLFAGNFFLAAFIFAVKLGLLYLAAWLACISSETIVIREWLFFPFSS